MTCLIGMEVKPCNGDTPLTDDEGKEYDCGSGVNRRDCPSNSYCHQTPRFARCCKKSIIIFLYQYFKICLDIYFFRE